MSMNHRASTVLVNDSGNANLGQSYLVNMFAVGATVVSTASTASPTVRAGHGFQVGDVLIVGIDTTKVTTVTAVSATSVTWSGAISLSAGDLLVNLGPDSLTGGTPDYDGSRMDIFSDMDGSTAISSAQVTADSTTGNYDYYHEGTGHHWELIRTAAGVPLVIVDGFSGDELTPGDYGANGDATDEVGQLQAMFWACSGLAKPIVFPPGKTYIISTGIDMQSKSNVHVKGNASTIKFDTSADSGNADPAVHTESILWFKTSSDVHIDGLNFNGNLSNRSVSGTESFMDCISIDDGSSDVLIENCFITEGMTDGIVLLINTSGTPCTRIQILNNHITKCRRNNISVIAGTDVDIIGNKIEDAGLSNSKGTNPKAGIDVEVESSGGSGACDRIKVLNNKVTGSLGTYGITFSSAVVATDVEFAGNEVYSNPGSASTVAEAGMNFQYKSPLTTGHTGCTVHHNTVYLNGKGGIRCVDDAVESVKDNVIHTNAEYGIIWQSTQDVIAIVENNIFHGNGTGGSGLGIGVNSSSVQGALIVRGNTFYDNDGLAAAGDMDTADATFLFENNLIYDTQGTATQTLCSSSGAGSNARRIASGNVYRNLLTATYANFSIVTNDINVGSTAETAEQPTFESGISVGDSTDADVSALVVRRSGTDKALSWDESTGRFDLNDSLEIPTSFHLSGGFGDSCLMQVKSSEITLNTGGTDTDESGLLIGASIILGVVARVTTTITTATNWSIGDTVASGENRFTPVNSTMTAGETQIGLNHRDPTVATAALGPVQASSADLRITTTGTPGAGKIRVTVFLMSFVNPTS